MNGKFLMCLKDVYLKGLCVFTVVLALTLPLCALSKTHSAKKPNVIILYYDDFGFSDYGANDTKQASLTPNLDKLAKEGMRFTQAYSSDAVCTPSRYSLMTGRYMWRTSKKKGVMGGYSSPFISEDQFTIADMFKRAGYKTAMVGKWHLAMQFYSPQGEAVNLGNDRNVLDDNVSNISGDKIDFSKPLTSTPTAYGFDYFFGTSASLDMPPYAWIENQNVLYKGGIVTAEGVDFSKARLATNSDFQEDQPNDAVNRVRPGVYDPTFVVSDYVEIQTAKVTELITENAKDSSPFFIYVPFPSPHRPWSVAKQFDGETVHQYGDYVAQSDYYAGQILKALEDPDGDPKTKDAIADNTVIFMSSDNGPERIAQVTSLEHGRDSNGKFRGIKQDVWEGGVRVPLVIRWPGKIKANATTSNAVLQSDFLATMAQYLGVNLDNGMAPDSESFLPILEGYPMPKARRPGIVLSSYEGHRAIIDSEGQYKLIDSSGSGSVRKVSFDADDKEIENVKGVNHASPRQLYRLDVDPSERINLVLSDEPKYKKKEAELYTLLNEIRGDATYGTDGNSQVPPVDLDGDGIPNYFEDAFSILDAQNPKDAKLDHDKDGLNNLEEYRLRSNPNDSER